VPSAVASPGNGTGLANGTTAVLDSGAAALGANGDSAEDASGATTVAIALSVAGGVGLLGLALVATWQLRRRGFCRAGHARHAEVKAIGASVGIVSSTAGVYQDTSGDCGDSCGDASLSIDAISASVSQAEPPSSPMASVDEEDDGKADVADGDEEHGKQGGPGAPSTASPPRRPSVAMRAERALSRVRSQNRRASWVETMARRISDIGFTT
jgi:hypothetical protein